MMRTSAHAREVQLAAPAREQRLAEPTVDRLAKLRVLGNDRLSLQPRLLEDGGGAQQAGGAELRQAGLARAEELAGTAQLQGRLRGPGPRAGRRHRLHAPLG